MKIFVIILLCAVIVNARWSLHYSAKQDDHDHEELDWWENGVFYQVKSEFQLKK